MIASRWRLSFHSIGEVSAWQFELAETEDVAKPCVKNTGNKISIVKTKGTLSLVSLILIPTTNCSKKLSPDYPLRTGLTYPLSEFVLSSFVRIFGVGGAV